MKMYGRRETFSTLNELPEYAREETNRRGQRKKVVVNRPSCDQLMFNTLNDEVPENTTFKGRLANEITKRCSPISLKEFFISIFPFLMTLKTYKLRHYILRDILAGLSLGITHIPQGMALSLLAGVPPVYGLYTSFWQPLIYFFFQKIRHNSFGSMAVMSLLVGAVVERESLQLKYVANMSVLNSTMQDDQFKSDTVAYKTGLAVCFTLLIGIIQITMGILRLGIVNVFMPASYISGFTTGAAFHIVTSQLSNIFGIKSKCHFGVFKIPRCFASFCLDLPHTNVATLIFAIITMIFLISCRLKAVNNRFKEIFKIPIPAELLVVIIGTIVNYFGQFSTIYKVPIVGSLPRGIPAPALPPMGMAGNVLFDSFVAAILSFVVSMSLAKPFAQKYEYQVDPNHELLACGITHTISSFFRCYPGASASPRCFIYDACDGQTSVAHLVSSVLLLLTLFVIGPLFEYLPNAILGSLILISLIPLFFQFKDLKTLHKISKLDFAIWIITCLATVLLDISIGLCIGIAFALVSHIAINAFTEGYLMGNVGHQDLYASIITHRKAKQQGSVRIFRFNAPLFYATAQQLKDELLKTFGDLKSLNKKIRDNPIISEVANGIDIDEFEGKYNSPGDTPTESITTVILDCSAFTNIDIMGIVTLSEISIDFQKVNVELVLCNVCSSVQLMLAKYNLSEGGHYIPLYPTIQDAMAAKCSSKLLIRSGNPGLRQKRRCSYFGIN